MKKRILAMLFALSLLLLCSCGHLNAADDLPGMWRSEDGYTVVFDGSEMTVRNDSGEMLEGFPVVYIMSGNRLNIYSDGFITEVFECRVDGDSLTLIYSDSFLNHTIGTAEKTVSIELVRCDEAQT